LQKKQQQARGQRITSEITCNTLQHDV